MELGGGVVALHTAIPMEVIASTPKRVLNHLVPTHKEQYPE